MAPTDPEPAPVAQAEPKPEAPFADYRPDYLLVSERGVFVLNDVVSHLAVLTREGVHLTDFEGRFIRRQVTHVLWDPIMAEKGGYKHFMLKEIFEQPRAVRDTLLGRVGQESGHVFMDEMDIRPEEFHDFEHVRIVACGTSWHAALAGKFMIERLARLPVEVDVGANGYIIVTDGAVYMAGTIVPSAGTVRELSAVSTVSIVSTATLKSSASNGSRYVVGGTGGTLVYSDTGYNAWTIVTNPPPTNISINSITWSASLNLFVAVDGEFSSTTTGGKSYITTSPDGVTWTERQFFSSANQLNAVAYNGSYFLALGSGFYEARSADGVT